MLYYIDKNWCHLIKEYLKRNFKICFSRTYSPSRVTKQTYFGNFTCLQLHFGCPELWGKCYVTSLRKPPDDWFCIFHSSFFIDFCHPTNRNQVFSILEHLLSQLSQVINMNFAFEKLHFLTTKLLLLGTTQFILGDITWKLEVFIVLNCLVEEINFWQNH